MIKPILFILLIFFALSCGQAGSTTKSNDQANLQGVWLAQTESQNGIKKEVTYQYIFKEDIISFIDETGKEMKYFFKLDTSAKPRLMIIQQEGSPIDSKPVSVAYELSGDSLKIVVATEGLRPTEISDKNNQELIICKRKG